jgi:hypothetical protein
MSEAAVSAFAETFTDSEADLAIASFGRGFDLAGAIRRPTGLLLRTTLAVHHPLPSTGNTSFYPQNHPITFRGSVAAPPS